MFISLRIKILGLLILLVGILAIVFTERASELIRLKMTETFEDHLAGVSQGVRAFWDRESKQIIRTAGLYSESEKVVSYSLYGLHNLLQREIRRLIAGTGYFDIEMQLKSGLTISASADGFFRGSALDPRDPQLNLTRVVIDKVDHFMELRARVPILKLGDLIGLLTLRRRISDEVLREVGRMLQVELAIAVKGEILATSLPLSQRSEFLKNLYDRVSRPQSAFTMQIGGIPHSITLIDIGETPKHDPVAIYAILSQGKMQQMIEEARAQTIRITAVALTLALIFSIVFAEFVLTSRLRRLRDSSQTIAQGDLSVRIPVDTGDELGDLARSFNEMTSNLQENRNRLVQNNDELQRSLETLETLKSYIQDILSSLNTCVLTLNRQGRVETVNEAAKRELAAVYPTLVGLSLRSFLKGLQKKERVLFIGALKAFQRSGGTAPPFDLEFESPAHGVKVMQANLANLRDLRGTAYGLILTLEDITQRKIIEKQLYHADKLSSIGQLAASVAHEIKNPLASIKTLGQLLQEETDSGDTRREYIDVIVSEVNRLNGVVEQLLRYARPEESSFRVIKLSELLQPVTALIHHELERHRVQLHVEMPEEVLVLVDGEKIKQVFLNLIFNGIQAMPDGGMLTLKAWQDQATPWTICQISDTGSGMSEEVVKRVFEPFFTTKQRGTGLGLAIVKKIIDLHGGTIEVTSRPGEGTTFTFYLPRERKEQES
ncbi:MAG TPA: ATP-binding protein [Candidatus Ozemobacteraceae bacterium]|nr:ATP-binding protein [Candidatus Ozemobacteraceae bacterium]